MREKREFVNIRLTLAGKYIAEEIRAIVEPKLESKIDDGLIEQIEEDIYARLDKELLYGISITTHLKVSTSSIIEIATKETKDYTVAKWQEFRRYMSIRPIDTKGKTNVGTLTPRLYLDKELKKRLNEYQQSFMFKEEAVKVKISEVIAIVLYAYFLQIKGIEWKK